MLDDLRFAVRYLKRKPVATGTIVSVLALGIGVHSALFSVIQAVSIRPAPAMPRDERQVRITGIEQLRRGTPWRRRGGSYGELRALAARAETFSDVAGYVPDAVILAGEDLGARDASVQFVTSTYFRATGVGLARGHGLRAGDNGIPSMEAIISYRLWEELFNKSDTTVGSVLRVNESDVRVAGVAPQRFQGPLPTRQPTMLWIPISARAEIVHGTPAWLASPDSMLFTTFGRLAPGVSTEQANAVAREIAMAALARRAARSDGAIWSADVGGLRTRPGMLEQDLSLYFTIAGLGTAALLVLLVACTNVSSLLVAAAVERRHEIAVRLSLGASRARVVRQLVTESALIATMGGLSGLALYWGLMRVIGAQVVDNVDLSPDPGTLGFTLVFAIGTGILFGLSPALHATRAGISTAMRETGGGTTRRSRLQSGFVVAQIALTQPLLVALGVILSIGILDDRTFPDEHTGGHIVAASFGLSGGTSLAARESQIRALAQRVAREPGVTAIVPESDEIGMRRLSVVPEDRGTGPRARDAINVIIEGAAPGYLALQEVPILLGRDLEAADTLGQQISALIPSDLAREFWDGASPIGRRLDRVANARDTADRRQLVVVGVYDAAKPTTRRIGRRVYIADSSRWARHMFLARTEGPAAALVPRLRTLFRDAAPDLPVLAVETVNDMRVENARETYQIGAGLLVLGGLALLLASIGLYGVVALAVGQRTREIGVRIALGGRPLGVARMFFANGVKLSVIGVVVGLPLCMAGLKVAMASAAGKGLALNVPLIAGSIAAIVVAVASLATWVPARRAAFVDPAVALRGE